MQFIYKFTGLLTEMGLEPVKSLHFYFFQIMKTSAQFTCQVTIGTVKLPVYRSKLFSPHIYMYYMDQPMLVTSHMWEMSVKINCE